MAPAFAAKQERLDGLQPEALTAGLRGPQEAQVELVSRRQEEQRLEQLKLLVPTELRVHAVVRQVPLPAWRALPRSLRVRRRRELLRRE
jgi:hypothetical protein